MEFHFMRLFRRSLSTNPTQHYFLDSMKKCFLSILLVSCKNHMYINCKKYSNLSFFKVTGDVQMNLDIDREIEKQQDIELAEETMQSLESKSSS